MKYLLDVVVDKPLEQVVALFDSFEHMKKWMEGFQSFEHLSGKAGEPGAKTLLKFKTGKRQMEMVETILEKDLPKVFKATYEVQGVYNIVTCRFVAVADNKTQYISEQEFQFKGFMKIIAFLMPGMFKKQTMKYLRSFKSFAENYSEPALTH